MCGIVFYKADKSYVSELESALQALEHRGPDSKCILPLNKNKVALGHVRLSIVDLDGGRQPISCQNNQVHIVVNGEFYEYQSIREQFKREGYKFKTKSDSEILIPLYQKYGMNLFDHLNGEFSFVLYDQEKDLVISARDRFGIKPLYYTLRNNELFIASEIKALLKFNIPAKWNKDSILFSDHFIPRQDQTVFKNIHPIKAGHFLHYQKGRMSENSYWDISYSEKKEGDDRELIESFKTELFRSIKSRLQGDVDIGSYLSGGLDSTAILSIAMKLSKKPIRAFSIKFDDDEYDESYLALESAKFLNANINIVDVNDSNIAENFESAIYHNEGLIYNNQSVAKYILSKAVHDAGIKVVLTGEGADEILAGYSFFRSDLINLNNSSNDKDSLIDNLKKANSASSHVFLANTDSPKLERVNQLIGYIPSMWHVGAKYALMYEQNIYPESFIEENKKRNVFVELIESTYKNSLEKASPVERSLYLWSKTNLPEVILSFLGDRMEMAHSVEGRIPFLDQKVAELSQSLPLNLKIRNLTEKYILREAVKGEIPHSIYSRQKFPFSAPPTIRKSNKSKKATAELLLDLVHSEGMKAIPFYCRKKLLAYIKRVQKQGLQEMKSADPIIIRAASAVVLQKKFGLR